MVGDNKGHSQEEADWLRVLSVLTAIILLVASALTIVIELLAMGLHVPVDVFGWVFLLFPLSPYVLLFLFRSQMETERQMSGLLWGSVAISGFGVVVLWLSVVPSTDALRLMGLSLIPYYQWYACLILLAGIKIFAGLANCFQGPAQESDDTSQIGE